MIAEIILAAAFALQPGDYRQVVVTPCMTATNAILQVSHSGNTVKERAGSAIPAGVFLMHNPYKLIVVENPQKLEVLVININEAGMVCEAVLISRAKYQTLKELH